MGMAAVQGFVHGEFVQERIGINARQPFDEMHVHVVAVSCVTDSQSGDPKSEPPDVWRCYGASVGASVGPVLPAAAEMFLGAWQHGIVGEYPVNLYL
jgi:hypothetical protein